MQVAPYGALAGFDLWSALANGLIAIEELLSGEMFRERPAWTWKYLRQVEQACRGAKFNRGHAVIAEMEQHFPRVWTLTQNVDGFHRAAGARNVIAIHGDRRQLRCTGCPRRDTVDDYAHLADLPRCGGCSAVLRWWREAVGSRPARL